MRAGEDAEEAGDGVVADEGGGAVLGQQHDGDEVEALVARGQAAEALRQRRAPVQAIEGCAADLVDGPQPLEDAEGAARAGKGERDDVVRHHVRRQARGIADHLLARGHGSGGPRVPRGDAKDGAQGEE